jgi:hypothetical protein
MANSLIWMKTYVTLAADEDKESFVAYKAYLIEYVAGDNVTLATIELNSGCKDSQVSSFNRAIFFCQCVGGWQGRIIHKDIVRHCGHCELYQCVRVLGLTCISGELGLLLNRTMCIGEALCWDQFSAEGCQIVLAFEMGTIVGAT